MPHDISTTLLQKCRTTMTYLRAAVDRDKPERYRLSRRTALSLKSAE